MRPPKLVPFRPLRRRLRGARHKRGVALIMVLGSLAILTVMLTEFQDEGAAELGSAVNARDTLRAEYAARSAINLSRLLIATEPTIRKSLALLFVAMGGPPPQIPVWEYADRALGAFNDADGTAAFSGLAGVDISEGKNLGFEGAGFESVIVDEDSKINLNTPARNSEVGKARLAAQLIGLFSNPEYDPLFENRDADGQFSDRSAICAAIVDWTDLDQDLYPCDPHSGTAQATGAEDSFYALLANPYARRNAAFDSLEELRLVRGVGDDFWATFIEPSEDPGDRTVTIWGQGKINVNTANAFTVWAVICGNVVKDPPQAICTDPAQTAAFISALTMVGSFTQGIPLFATPKAFLAALNGKGMFGSFLSLLSIPHPIQVLSPQQMLDAITTESKVFSIYATGKSGTGKNQARVRIHAVVDFRDAPPPGLPVAWLPGQQPQAGEGGPPPQAPAAAGPGAVPEGATADTIAAAFQPSPGGNVVYYRVE